MEKRLVAIIGAVAVAAAVISIGAVYAASGQVPTTTPGTAYGYGYGGMMGRAGYSHGPSMMNGYGQAGGYGGMMGGHGGMMGSGGAAYMRQYMWRFINSTSAP